MQIKKKFLVGLILFILTTNTTYNISAFQEQNPYEKQHVLPHTIPNIFNPLNSDFFPHSVYEPHDITLRDTAYHKSYHRLHVEWWFFEGIFENGYSTAFFILIVSKENTIVMDPLNTCVFWLTLYKDTELKFFSTTEFSFETLIASEEYPFIKMYDDYNTVFMKLDLEQYQKCQWSFNVSYQLNDLSTPINSTLNFIGTTQGYAGEMLGGWYGPILPKASVEGTLTFNNEDIKVTGLGYLEHGWDIPLPIWEYGWFFGKIVSDSFCIMWGRMMQTRWYEDGRAAILSKDEDGYLTITPKNFTFTPTKYRYNNGDIIPTKFIFNLSDPGISINITLETLNIHHFTSLAGLSNCWRFHVLVNGQITYGNTTEQIHNKIQIMGIMRFR